MWRTSMTRRQWWAAIASPCLSLRSAAAGGGAQSSPDPRPGNISSCPPPPQPCPVSAVRHEATARPDPPGPSPHNQRVSFCCHRLREKNFTIQLIRRVGRRSDYPKFMTDAVQTIMTKLSQQLWVSSVLVYENTSNSWVMKRRTLLNNVVCCVVLLFWHYMLVYLLDIIAHSKCIRYLILRYMA